MVISYPATASPDSRSTASQIEFATGTRRKCSRAQRDRKASRMKEMIVSIPLTMANLDADTVAGTIAIAARERMLG
jgi:hypothetical protein